MYISKFKTHDMEDEIAGLEKKYGIALPEQYRSFMLRYNGGETPLTVYKNKRDGTDVRAFFGIGDVDYYSFDKFDNEWAAPISDWVKKGLFPIAADSLGNYFAIGIGGDETGSVFFCDHEKGYKAKPVSADLREFVSQCKSKKIGKIRTIEEREQQVRECGGIEPDDDVRRVWQEEIDKFSKYKQEKVTIE